jgi:hypothetical protein
MEEVEPKISQTTEVNQQEDQKEEDQEEESNMAIVY